MLQKLKQYRDLKQQGKTLASKLASHVVTVESNWGKIKFTINGNMEAQSLSIHETLIEKTKKTDLERDILNLFNEGAKKVRQEVAKSMAKEGGLPNLTNLLK